MPIEVATKDATNKSDHNLYFDTVPEEDMILNIEGLQKAYLGIYLSSVKLHFARSYYNESYH